MGISTRHRVVGAAIASATLVTGVLAAPSATSAKPPDDRGNDRLEFTLDEAALEFAALDGAEAMWGVRSGAGYRIEVPDNWNGGLVLYAHGYRGDGPELTVSNPPIRQYLIDQGYAWAASSYRKNGYVPATGARDTHALIAEFTGKVSRPDQVFITGHSMGGHVTGVAIEQWPNAFDGAVPMCGVMGDVELYDYFQDAYLLAEYFAGNDPVVPTPDDYYTSSAWSDTIDTLIASGGVADYQDAIEQITGGDRPTYDEGFAGPYGGFFAHYFGVAATGPERSNIDTTYQLDGDPAISDAEAMLNDLIPRVDYERQARHPNGLGVVPGTQNEIPRIDADFDIPVVSLHTTGELFVPFSMQQIYAERALATGSDEWLEIRAIRDITHCGFTVGEQVAAFADMVNWVENGVRPAGDDVLDPAVVADDQFGCQFTLVDRPGLAPCTN